jgi:hypothetical protein
MDQAMLLSFRAQYDRLEQLRDGLAEADSDTSPFKRAIVAKALYSRWLDLHGCYPGSPQLTEQAITERC